jgi:hypothetical protein
MYRVKNTAISSTVERNERNEKMTKKLDIISLE